MATYTQPQRWKKAKGYEERERPSILLILDLKDSKLKNLGQQGGKVFHMFGNVAPLLRKSW